MLTIELAIQISRVLFFFVFLYPIGMSIVWMAGTITYYRNKQRHPEILRNVEEIELVIVMPVHNEGDVLNTTIRENLKQEYSHYSLYIIDDCSNDDTYEIAKSWSKKDARVQVFQTKENMGKANALNQLLQEIDTDYFVCIDGDACLAYDALSQFCMLLDSYEDKDNVGAITGQPKLLDGDASFIHKLQRVEYRSIISMIKKSQGLFHHIFSVSGVCTLYNTKMMRELEGFNVNNQTEDIEITWRMQRQGYVVKYEPSVMVYMYTPNTYKQLLRQRIRWSIGGLQTINQNVFHKHDKKLHGELKIFAVEYYVSTIWAFAFFVSTFMLIFLLLFGNLGMEAYIRSLTPIIILATYAFVLMYIGYKYEIGEREPFKEFLKSSFIIALIYWTINPISLVFAFFQYYFLKRRGGTWKESRVK